MKCQGSTSIDCILFHFLINIFNTISANNLGGRFSNFSLRSFSPTGTMMSDNHPCPTHLKNQIQDPLCRHHKET